jgi:RNA polymerase sigma factor (sigma-70 family)
MEHRARIGLLDEAGRPFGPHVDEVLRSFLSKLARDFPALRDEAELAEVLEVAGRKIVERERRDGPIEKLHAFAWVAVRNEATSRLRRGSMRIARATVTGEDAENALSTSHAHVGTPEQIEADILMQELLAQLTPEERLVCAWKRLGFSSKEIAQQQGTTVERVNTFFHRVKQKIRGTLRPRDVNSSSSASPQPAKPRTA